jgi:hypothetical protein
VIRWVEPSSERGRPDLPLDFNHPEVGVFREVRRYIVVYESHNAALCVPIHTYGGRGHLKPDIRREDHARVYGFYNTPPQMEHPLRAPIGIVFEGKTHQNRLHPASVANFGKIYTVEHGALVANVGYVHKDHINRLRVHFDAIKANEDRNPTADIHRAPPMEIDEPSSKKERGSGMQLIQRLRNKRPRVAEAYINPTITDDASSEVEEQGIKASSYGTSAHLCC